MIFKNKRKGQHLIIEELVIFSIGLFIALGFLGTFQFFSKETKEEAVREQVSSVLAYLKTKVVETSKINGNGKIIAEIPEKVAEDSYQIELSNNGVTILSSSGKVQASGVHGLEESFMLEGKTTSNFRRVFFLKDGNKITVGGED